MFPVTREWVYLYNGGINACPRPVGNAMRRFIENWEQGGREAWPSAFEDFLELRHAFGRLIGASGDQVVITESTTAGINLAAQMIRPGAHQNVVVTDLEFMSDTYPWLLSHDAQVRFVPEDDGVLRREDFERLINKDTAAVSVSAVAVGSGCRVDLRSIHDLASHHNVPLLVDGAQAVGVVPLDVHDPQMDFLVCTASKWLWGPTGIGFLFVGERFMEARPPAVGWMAAENRSDWDLRNPRLYSNSMRFQGGIPNLVGAVGALAGIRLIEQIGVDAIHTRVLELSGYLLERLSEMGQDIWTPRDKNERAGIVFFRHPRARPLYEALRAQRIYTGCFLGGIRLDVHAFNTFRELDRTLQVIRDFG